MSERALTEVQYAIEATAGTTIAATKKLLKVVEPLKPDRVPSFPEEDFAARAKSLRSWIGQHLISDTLTFEQAYFEMLPFIFSCGIVGLAAPTATVGTAMYSWPYTPSMVALNTPKSFSLEKANGITQEHCGYGMFERINIKGTINQGAEVSPVVITCDFFAKEWSTAAPANIAPPVVYPINAKLATLSIDLTWALMIGGAPTLKTNTLRAFEYDIITGLHPKHLGTHAKYLATHGEGIIDVTASFTFEGNANANTEFGHYRTQTNRAVRLDLINSATAGAPLGANSQLRIDLFGRWVEVIPFADQDRGNNLHTMVMQSILDPTDYLGTPDMLDILVVSSNNTP